MRAPAPPAQTVLTPMPRAAACSAAFPFEVVDAVDEPVAVGRNDLRRVLGRHEDRLHLDAAVGIDEQAALPEHLGLRASVGALKGGQLAVRVRERHIVAVDQRDAAHRRADQSLHGPAADAAQPHHGHMRAGEAPGALLAEKDGPRLRIASGQSSRSYQFSICPNN